ncbi:hypothetical protein AHAS_Ahas19G0072200 [Arachis hypogaea]
MGRSSVDIAHRMLDLFRTSANCVCGSDDDYDDEESFEARGVPGQQKCAGDVVDGNGSGGANDVESSGPSRQVVAKDLLGREFAMEEDVYAAYKNFARFRDFGVRKGNVGRANGILVHDTL